MTMIFTETINVSGLRPLASGARRDVYTLPRHPDLLIKVTPVPQRIPASHGKAPDPQGSGK